MTCWHDRTAVYVGHEPDPLLREWSIYEDVTESASVDLSPVLSAIATVPAAVDRATC